VFAAIEQKLIKNGSVVKRRLRIFYCRASRKANPARGVSKTWGKLLARLGLIGLADA